MKAVSESDGVERLGDFLTEVASGTTADTSDSVEVVRKVRERDRGG